MIKKITYGFALCIAIGAILTLFLIDAMGMLLFHYFDLG